MTHVCAHCTFISVRLKQRKVYKTELKAVDFESFLQKWYVFFITTSNNVCLCTTVHIFITISKSYVHPKIVFLIKTFCILHYSCDRILIVFSDTPYTSLDPSYWCPVPEMSGIKSRYSINTYKVSTLFFICGSQ